MLHRVSKVAFGGMWVFPGGRVDDGDRQPGDDEAASARRAAAREALEECGLAVDPDDLVPFSHWVPPPVTPRRLSTHFFLARASDGEVVVDGGEIHEHEWLAARRGARPPRPWRGRPGAADLDHAARPRRARHRRGRACATPRAATRSRTTRPAGSPSTAAPWRCGRATAATTTTDPRAPGRPPPAVDARGRLAARALVNVAVAVTSCASSC